MKFNNTNQFPRQCFLKKESIFHVWAQPFEQQQQIEVLQLMNLIIKKETTIGYRWPLELQKGMDLMKQTAKSIAEGKVHMLLSLNSKESIVGHVLLVQNHLPNCAHVGELAKMFVHPKYRSMSLIRSCIREIVKYSNTIGIETLRLDVRADTKIERLWKMMGFEPFGKMKDYVRVDGCSYSGTFMWQKIDILRSRFK